MHIDLTGVARLSAMLTRMAVRGGDGELLIAAA
jgi:hypothetical protein